MEAATKDGGWDLVVCLGDLVGYGADPNRVTEWVRANVGPVVRGNHDKACVGLDDLEWFNPAARISTLWTRANLSEENRQYLADLPRGPLAVDGFQILHGSPLDEDEYLIMMDDAEECEGALEATVTFFGHTHLQGGFRFHVRGIRRVPQMGPGSRRHDYEIDSHSKYLINPGSVGQPRDNDPRAAWCVYLPEEHQIIYRRVDYDIEAAQKKIVEAGMPEILARRLSVGK